MVSIRILNTANALVLRPFRISFLQQAQKKPKSPLLCFPHTFFPASPFQNREQEHGIGLGADTIEDGFFPFLQSPVAEELAGYSR